VFRIPAAGGDPIVEWEGAIDTNRPNGLVLSLDESLLYVADSTDGVVRRFAVAADGSLTIEDEPFIEDIQAPDGMELDTLGNLFIAASDGVRVYAPGRHALQRLDIDFVSEFSSLLPVRVLGLLLGLDESLTARLQRWADDLLAIPADQPTPPRREQIRASLDEMELCFEELLAARRAAPGEDLISDLVRAEQAGQIERHESLSFLFALIPAGVETTVHLLGNAMVVLARHTHVCARVLADPGLLPALIEEVLRLEPPAHSSLRLVTEDAEDTEIGGVRIPRHAVLVVLLAAALRDEERFPHPDEPVLDRGRTSPLPFGHGVHYCPGHLLARLEARLGLEALFSRIRGYHLHEPEVTWTQSLIARGPVSLPVRLEPRASR
jgi:cytochrome P450